MNCISCELAFQRYGEYCNDCNGGKGEKMMAKYTRKPEIIEAVQFLGFEDGSSSFSDRPDWLVKQFGEKILFFGRPYILDVVTPEGTVDCNIGDYIVGGVWGNLSVWKPDAFQKTFKREPNEEPTNHSVNADSC
jgi:hypothetical protein